MSYSKWGQDSRWFACWMPTDAAAIDDELFEIDSYYQLTYGDIAALDVEAAIQMLVHRPEGRHNIGSFFVGKSEIKYDLDIRKATPEELEELAGYVRQWMEEVETKWTQD